jgi:hypothetical protein
MTKLPHTISTRCGGCAHDQFVFWEFETRARYAAVLIGLSLRWKYNTTPLKVRLRMVAQARHHDKR